MAWFVGAFGVHIAFVGVYFVGRGGVGMLVMVGGDGVRVSDVEWMGSDVVIGDSKI